MANSFRQAQHKGVLHGIYNQTLRFMEWYRKTKRGRWVRTNPFVKGSTLGQRSYSHKQFVAMVRKANNKPGYVV